MRVFQNIFVYSAYLRRLTLSLCAPGVDSFESRRSALIDDRYCSVHYLEGQDGSDVFLLSNEDGVAQRAWANENGMKASTSSHDILLAQIEAHRSEVFYTQDPGRYGPDFLSRLPQCVRVRVAWQSPPAPPGDLTGCIRPYRVSHARSSSGATPTRRANSPIRRCPVSSAIL